MVETSAAGPVAASLPADLPDFFASAAQSFNPSPTQPSSLARLSLTDRLLLAQAVHHLGESPPNWANVSSLMLAHPLIKGTGRLKSAQDAGLTLGRVFGSRECERAWTALMRINGLVSGEEDDEDTSGPMMKQRPKEARGLPPRTDRKSQLALAQILYAERMEELRDSIKKKEEQFKLLATKIEQIQSGQADESLLKELAEIVAATKEPTVTQPPPAEADEDVEKVAQKAADIDEQRESASTAVEDAQPPSSPVASTSKEPIISPSSTSGRSRGRPTRTRTTTSRTADSDLGAGSSPVEASERGSREPSREAVQPEKEKPSRTRKSSLSSVAQEEAEEQGMAEVAKADDEAAPEVVQEDHAAAKLETDNADTSQAEAVEEEGEAEGEAEEGPAVQERRSSRRNPASKEIPGEAVHETPSAKRKRGKDEDAGSNAEEDADDASAKSKRARGMAVQTAEEEPHDPASPSSATAKRGRPTPTPRRSRRGAKAAEDDEGAEDSSMEIAKATEETAATPASSGRAKAGGRRSMRGQSARSREASEADGLDADEDGDTSMTIAATADDVDVKDESSIAASRRPSLTSRRGEPRREKGRPSLASTGRQSTDNITRDKEREKRRKANEKMLIQIWTEVSSHTHGNLFQSDVKESDAPDYHTLIRRPTSLKTIKAQIKDGDVATITQLRRALNHLFANALVYNRPDSEVGRMAREMREATEGILDRYEETRNMAGRR